jgi:hypothetical protein
MHAQSLSYLMFWDIIFKLWVFKSFILIFFRIDLNFHFEQPWDKEKKVQIRPPFLIY